MDDSALHAAILKAHEIQDSQALARLYTTAAQKAEEAGQLDSACFFLTQAYVFALEFGSPRAAELRARLAEYGRIDP